MEWVIRVFIVLFIIYIALSIASYMLQIRTRELEKDLKDSNDRK